MHVTTHKHTILIKEKGNIFNRPDVLVFVLNKYQFHMYFILLYYLTSLACLCVGTIRQISFEVAHIVGNHYIKPSRIKVAPSYIMHLRVNGTEKYCINKPLKSVVVTVNFCDYH